ncbi:MAG: 3-deoxy-D-manno-octulosonic acid transferase [Fimbriimonadaceae bacterium]
MRALYNLLLVLASPLWMAWMLSRARKRRELPVWRERFGRYDLPQKRGGPRIWLHAVSVGEVLASLPILRELRSIAPDAEVVLSVTTSSGHRTARERAQGLFDHLVYFPLDLPWVVRRALASVQPDVLVLMETEIWMNLLAEARRRGTATVVANGRVSGRSFRRSLRFRRFFRAALANLDWALMQTEEDARRIRELGARNVAVIGNCKFDQAVEGLEADPREWRRILGLPEGVPAVVIGSTRGPDEEDLVLEALGRVGLKRLCAVHAPRHLERVPELYHKALGRLGEVALRSEWGGAAYVILDTYGELSQVYSVAEAVVIGGGFGEYGGQNLLQPLAHGKPVLHGPHMSNFAEVASAAAAEGATRVCATAEELASALEELLRDDALRRRMGEAARRFVGANLGASRRYAERILSAIRRT